MENNKFEPKIKKGKVEKLYRFSCADCPTVGEYSSRRKGQDMGWAIARDSSTCYCPKCAANHRSAGCKGVSGQQLKIG